MNRLAEIVKPLDLECAMRGNDLRISGDMEQLEDLVRQLEDLPAGKTSSALESLLGF